MMDRLHHLRLIAEDHGVTKVASHVLDNPRFPIWSGSVDNKHHYGEGGLLRHTHEVVELCRINAEESIENGHVVDRKVLFLAALFHDSGKMWDYQPMRPIIAGSPTFVLATPLHTVSMPSYIRWDVTSHKRLIHHIARSGIEWMRAVEMSGESSYLEESVLHCILSHHGRKEWGSPVEPQTKEAWLLHLCDGISARMDDCDRTPPRP